ncbi:hypothetical protein ACT3TA_18415, partial [Halomonas sp. AOP42-C1-46]
LNNNLSLNDLLDDGNIKKILLPSFAEQAANQMKFMLQLLKELFDLRVKNPEFKFAPSDYAIIELLQALYDKHPKQQASEPQQTKLIPSRLYAALISALKSELDDFNANADAIVELFRQRKLDPRFALPECHASSYKDSVAWKGIMAQYGLNSWFKSRSIANWLDLYAYISEVQSAAKYWIHLFTGMRANEARHLPADAYTTMKAGGADIHILRGYTSKIAGQNQTETFWMTAEIIEKGVIAA